MFSTNLESIVFNRHTYCQADELLIITGYIGLDPFSNLKNLPLNCNVIYGMYGADSIGEKLHNSLNQINSSLMNADLFYSQRAVHSKCYLWKKNGVIVDALIGSANFSRNGLATPDREVLVEADPTVFGQLQDYFDKVFRSSIPCNSSLVKIKSKPKPSIIAGLMTDCRLSFLAKKNGVWEVPAKSGLNWGVNSTQVGGTSHTCVGDAEIRITKEAIEHFSDLFPPKLGVPSKRSGKLQRQNDEIELIWDDGVIMKGLLEQNLPQGDLIYPKAICSSDSKAELGLYLRKRLGVSSTQVITKADLARYGRTDVTISLQGEGVYYMDFSV
jgi:hypothetical protein